MVIIRKATLKDCKTVYEFGESKELANPSGKPPALWWIQAFVKEKQIFFVAEEKNKIIGFILGEKIAGNLAIIHETFVDKSFRNKCVGRLLLKEFEKECKIRKIKGILLYGYAKKKTINFWEKEKFNRGSKEYEFFKFLKK